MLRTLYTIGHSNHSPERLIELLQQHGITAIADVRSHPYSRRLPYFSKNGLPAILRPAGIKYVFLGRELGARPDDLSCYQDGRAVYARIAATASFQQGLQRLRQGLQSEAIALLCAEKDPLTCHRTILVCRQLRHPELTIAHILASGALEAHAALERRLIEEFGLQQLDLFNPRSPAELLEEAYDRQGAAIAYVQTEEEGDDWDVAST